MSLNNSRRLEHQNDHVKGKTLDDQYDDNPLNATTALHNDELKRRRNQLWIGIWITNSIVLIITFLARRQMGDPISPLSIVIQVVLHSLVLANIIFLKTSYARILQAIYVVVIHMAVPPVLVLYGGTRGFGDIAILAATLVTILYGWRRWMMVTFGIMAITLGWVLYRDSIGQPVAPLLTYSAQFTALKFIITMLVMVFLLRYMNSFYNRMLNQYRNYAEEQVRLNQELKQSGVALEQLNDNLKLSRQKIVTAREEERRRLRRDLHDGFGPTLAAQIFRIGVARQLLSNDPEKTAAILGDLEIGIDSALGDVRKLVYGLRPPLLDQFGLVGAMVDFVKQHEGGIEISLDLPPLLPKVSAAIEVAVYRIFQTALDNVLKHAGAKQCQIKLEIVARELRLIIDDDGIGIKPDHLDGVGLTSMRERAEELSGSCQILGREPAGTRVLITLPLLLDTEATL